jgi:hypothetical protein
LVHQLSPSDVTPKPLVTTKVRGSIVTEADYVTVVEITVTKDKTFHLAKIVVSCPEDVMFKLVWDGEDISVEYYVMGKLPFTDWFPWGWHPCVGDGLKKLELQAKYPAGGIAETVHAEICGEEE